MRLTSEEKAFIKANEDAIDNVLSVIKDVQLFKEGDFLIAYHSDYINKAKLNPVVNSYGALKKFQVVHVDKHGVPYMKELNKNGKPTGQLISSIKKDNHRGMSYYVQNYIFEIDPGYADSIILDDEGSFNASEILKAKSDAFKAIAAHNKKIKVDCFDTRNLISFLSTVKVGDLLWRSNSSSWVVTEMNPIPRDIRGHLMKDDVFMKVNTNKGIEQELTLNSFYRIALYSDRPRSYRELKDPK